MHRYRELLKLVNPAEGYVSNTNSSPDMMYARSPLQAKDSPAYYAFEPGRTNERQRRILELLGGNHRMTEAEAKQVVMDETIPMARPWAPKLQQAMDARSSDANVLPASVHACMQRLAAFDGEFSKESRSALAFIELLRKLGADRARYQRLSAAISSTEPLDADQQRALFDGARDACSDLEKRLGRSDLVLGGIYRVGRGTVDLPVGSGQVPGASTIRALQFGPPGDGGKQRMTGGQRAPFLVHFAPEGVRSFAQVLYGVSDDPESQHFSDQARLASEKAMPEVALTREALMREGATVLGRRMRRVVRQ
jgi:acyl-homoserine-lactone acylase